jgi:hypothetical protein
MWVWLASPVRYSEGLILGWVMWVWLASPVRYSEGLTLGRVKGYRIDPRLGYVGVVSFPSAV